MNSNALIKLCSICRTNNFCHCDSMFFKTCVIVCVYITNNKRTLVVVMTVSVCLIREETLWLSPQTNVRYTALKSIAQIRPEL